jgi:hypothetical protein
MSSADVAALRASAPSKSLAERQMEEHVDLAKKVSARGGRRGLRLHARGRRGQAGATRAHPTKR